MTAPAVVRADELVVQRLLEQRTSFYGINPEDQIAAIVHLLEVEGLNVGQAAHRLRAHQDSIRSAYGEYQRRTRPRPAVVAVPSRVPAAGCTTRQLIEMAGLTW